VYPPYIHLPKPQNRPAPNNYTYIPALFNFLFSYAQFHKNLSHWADVRTLISLLSHQPLPVVRGMLLSCQYPAAHMSGVRPPLTYLFRSHCTFSPSPGQFQLPECRNTRYSVAQKIPGGSCDTTLKLAHKLCSQPSSPYFGVGRNGLTYSPSSVLSGALGRTTPRKVKTRRTVRGCSPVAWTPVLVQIEITHLRTNHENIMRHHSCCHRLSPTIPCSPSTPPAVLLSPPPISYPVVSPSTLNMLKIHECSISRR